MRIIYYGLGLGGLTLSKDCLIIVRYSLLSVNPPRPRFLDVVEVKTLKQIIVESGLTHQQLANILGVKSPRISELMRPGQDLRMSTSIKLAKALNVSLKTLAASIGQDVNGIPDDCITGGTDNK